MPLSKTIRQRLGNVARAAPSLKHTAKERMQEMGAGEPNPADPKTQYLWMRRTARQEGRPWRAAYAWSVLQAARSAHGLGLERVSALEFGVAGGTGLLALETAAEHAERLTGVGIDVFGFDTGGGLPAPTDPRDVPFLLKEGDYPMDQSLLRSRLQRAELVLGLVKDTVPKFLEEERAPVGFVSNDLDFYSSTMESFQILDAHPDRVLPRVFSYFDDVTLYPWTDFNGERAAIAEFNATRENRKISHVYGLRWWLPGADMKALWPEKIFVAELFDHPLYGAPEGVPGVQQLTLGL
ncbi:MAG TPA: hypothetical protein VEX39_18065 [Thermoleophilaceae bacterium]|nr:hypothetical protein [Thermoleophilaceae bacterium]